MNPPVKIIAALLLMGSVFFFSSCNSEDAQQPAASSTGTFPTSPVRQDAPAVSNNTTAPVVQNAAEVKLNPEHGKPGHRCDIAVGAPLPATAAANNTTAANTSATVPVTQTVTAPTTTAKPGMNPQHGQPGHRCDIAVGAPLSDTAKKKTTTPSNTATQTVQVSPDVANGTMTAGLNPKHGQPGHRCDIAVGAPLSDTAKKTVTAVTPATVPAQNVLQKPVIDTSKNN